VNLIDGECSGRALINLKATVLKHVLPRRPMMSCKTILHVLPLEEVGARKAGRSDEICSRI